MLLQMALRLSLTEVLRTYKDRCLKTRRFWLTIICRPCKRAQAKANVEQRVNIITTITQLAWWKT